MRKRIALGFNLALYCIWGFETCTAVCTKRDASPSASKYYPIAQSQKKHPARGIGARILSLF